VNRQEEVAVKVERIRRLMREADLDAIGLKTRSNFSWITGGGLSYVNAAFLFHEPMSLRADRPLRLRYRVLYGDGVWPADEFAELAAAYYEQGKQA